MDVPDRKASRTDLHVGKRLRLKRQSLGLTQQQLADRIGVRAQQMHKYENGANRISAGRLFECSQVLGVDISWFFEGLASSAQPVQPASPQEAELLYDPAALRAAQSLMRIPDRTVRRNLVRTIEALAEG